MSRAESDMLALSDVLEEKECVIEQLTKQVESLQLEVEKLNEFKDHLQVISSFWFENQAPKLS